MSAIIMDGKALAQRTKVDIAAAIGKLDKPVGLGTILVVMILDQLLMLKESTGIVQR